MDIAQIGQSLALAGGGIDTANRLISLFKTMRGASVGDQEAIAAAKDQAQEVKEALYAAKDTIFTLKDQIADAIVQIKDLEHRLAQRDEYTLAQIGEGAFAYVRKGDGGAMKNGPWLCQTCFDEGRTAVLQYKSADTARKSYKCPHCQAEIRIPYSGGGGVRSTISSYAPFHDL